MPHISTTVLKVEHLAKQYAWKNAWYSKQKNKFMAVDGISFRLHEGEILGLLGPNGAGKTTTIQILLSTLAPTKGKIEYFGLDFVANREQILQQVTFASSYIKLPWRLTVWENLQVYGMLYGLSRKDRVSRITRFLKYFGVWSLKDKNMSSLSAGQITRVMISKAFLSYPKIALLDEPTASLDPDIAKVVRDFIQSQRQEYGVSILFTSHNMAEVSALCDRVIFLRSGKIISEGKPDELAKGSVLPRLELRAVKPLVKLKKLCQTQDYHLEEKGDLASICLPEEKISWFLQELAVLQVSYSGIQIAKPTLEDYFLMNADVKK